MLQKIVFFDLMWIQNKAHTRWLRRTNRTLTFAGKRNKHPEVVHQVRKAVSFWQFVFLTVPIWLESEKKNLFLWKDDRRDWLLKKQCLFVVDNSYPNTGFVFFLTFKAKYVQAYNAQCLTSFFCWTIKLITDIYAAVGADVSTVSPVWCIYTPLLSQTLCFCIFLSRYPKPATCVCLHLCPFPFIHSLAAFSCVRFCWWSVPVKSKLFYLPPQFP